MARSHQPTLRTNVVGIVGEPTAFPGARATRLQDFRDGTENTILLTEIADSDIPWLEPRDLCFQEMSFTVNDPTRPSISCSRRRGPYVVFADSIHAYTIRGVHPEVLRTMATIDGGEEIAVADVSHEWLTSFSAPPITDEALLQFRHWPRVREVRLIRTRISDAGLDALTGANSLRHLKLSDAPITDEGLAALEALPNLKWLTVYETAVSQEGEAALLTARPGVRVRQIRD